MHTKHFPWRYSIYKRLIIMFLIVVTILCAVTGVIYYWQSQKLKEEINLSIQSQVNYYLERFETDISSIQTAAILFSDSTYLGRLSLIPETLTAIEQWQYTSQIQYQLMSLKNGNTALSSAKVIIPQRNMGINESSTIPFDAVFYESLRQNFDLPFTQVNGRLYMCFFVPSFRTPTEESTYTICLELSLPKIASSLDALISDKGEQGFIDIAGVSLPIGSPDPKLIQMVRESEQEQGTVTYQSSEYIFVKEYSEQAHTTLCKIIAKEKIDAPLHVFDIILYAVYGFGIVIVLSYSYYVYRYAHLPMKQLSDSFHLLEQEHFDLKLNYPKNNEYKDIFQSFNNMAERLNTLINQIYRQELLTKDAQLKQLQSQINPHFLYNSFFVLSTMAQLGDLEIVQSFSQQLGEYFQYITRNSTGVAKLCDEVKHARVYTEIQGLRFRGRLQIDFADLPESFRDYTVPKLIIQPLLENIFEHGIGNLESAAWINVDFRAETDALLIIVEDSNPNFTEEKLAELQQRLADADKQTEKTGTLNIHLRLTLKYGDEFGLVASQSDLGGLKMAIRLPIEIKLEN